MKKKTLIILAALMTFSLSAMAQQPKQNQHQCGGNHANCQHSCGKHNATTTNQNKEVVIVGEERVEEEEVLQEQVYTTVEQNPEFPGGEEALYKYLANNIVYPQKARENGITGTVLISFVVEKDGSITLPTIMRNVDGGCGAEALRVVKGMPKWKPGRQGGRPVRTQFILPVSFTLK
ncbi:MAG: energy transducer TonB [Bacteroidales bacterium]|nr:energy transducer TonB [Bacteroidales bacterium]